MKLTISKRGISKKPSTHKEVAILKSSIKEVVDVNMEELVFIVQNLPFNLSEASGISERDWLSQQMFGLDFDSGVDVKPVIEYCRKYSLIPNVIYSTSSNTTEKPRFRVIFILDTPIMDYNIAKRVQTGIVSLFKSDENCKDDGRMFYPGPAVIHRDDELNESSWFVSTILGSTVGESVINQK